MKAVARLVMSVAMSVGVALIGPASAQAAASPSPLGASEALLGSALVVPSMQGLVEDQQVLLEREAVLSDPVAVAERALSRSRYEGVGGAGAVSLARQFFGIERPAWVAPGSSGEGKLTKYLSETSAVERTPSGEKLFVTSSVPLRSAVGSGRLAPLSFSLEEQAGSFVPENPLVPVSISKRVVGGVSLPLGVSFAPLEAAAPEVPVVVGDRVVFPGTATDTDFMVEPTPSGVEASWQLLSEESPQDNSLRFALPEGAKLQLSKTAVGAAEIVREGQVLAMIAPAAATEADGSSLPASYVVSGSTLTTHVDLSGSVAFPVLVDPEIIGNYGSAGGAGSWAGWSSQTNCACLSVYGGPSYRVALSVPGSPAGSYGQWYVYAPGAGTVGGAGITRVDLQGVRYAGVSQTELIANLGLSSGSLPVWTYNGLAGAQGSLPLVTQGPVGSAIAACAQEGGGYDGGNPGLCNENDAGQYFTMQLYVLATTDANTFYEFTGAVVRYLDNVAPDEASLHGVPSGWVQHAPSSSVYITGHDQGTGIQAVSLEIPPGHLNEAGQPVFAQEFGCSGANGFAGCPQSATSSPIDLSGLATGEYTLGAYAFDAVGNIREAPDPKLYVDHSAPGISPFGGPLAEHVGGSIGAGSYALYFSASDGSVSAPQSGVHLFTVSVDGKKVAESVTSCPLPSGKPTEECLGLSGSWTMEGQKYGPGQHTVTVTARDWVGNEESQAFTVTVNEAANEPVGPGTVNVTTGDFKLSSMDVSVAAAGGELTVGRAYDSRSTQGEGGPLGPQWSLSLPDAAANGIWRSLTPMPNGSVQVTTASNQPITFTVSGSGFTPPTGYPTLKLSKLSSVPLEYQLTDASGDATTFTRPGVEDELQPLVPSSVQQASGAGGLNKLTYIFTRTTGNITEPKELIAPYPASINCVASLVNGCRALEFIYATTTTASGEGKSQWGDFKERLKEVKLVAWSPAGKKMEHLPVAQYSYDGAGKLRSEWDPENPLKTYYGYDTEGHLSAVTAPGQETWALTYGAASASDLNTGRLLKAFQAPATTALWSGETLTNTELPKITGTAAVGARLAVSKGTWSGTPVTTGYTWLTCRTTCTSIPGANGPNYTPTTGDLGATIMARVSAINGAGTAAMGTVATAAVVSLKSEYTVGSGKQVRGITAGSDGNLWFSYGTTTASKIGKSTTAGSITPYGQGTLFEGITSGSDGNLWLADKTANNVAHITTGGTSGQLKLTRTGAEPVGIVNGSDNNLWVTESGASYIAKVSTGNTVLGEYALPAGSQPRGIASGPDKNLWVTEYGTSKIAKITTTGTVTEYALPAGSKPVAIAAGADGNLWVAERGTDKIAKITTAGAITEYALPSGSQPQAITAGPGGNVWFANEGSSKIGVITPSGVITEYALAGESRPTAITPGPDGNVWYGTSGTSVIGKLTPPTEGAVVAPSPGITMEYNVPLYGSGLPGMSSDEVEKWAQGPDVPAEATAIFPADEPQNWPASDYRRATIFYVDRLSHTTNVATPNGGIATQEYDSQGNPTRSLSPDNRAAALKETKPAEAAKPLYSESKYNSEGTELMETLGPEHKVKLPSGSELMARKQVKYVYNEEGAPSGGPYRLPSETTEDALSAGKEEDKRSVANSYAGQEGLGWKLHAPTSTTVAPAGMHLTHTATYSPSTGAQTETAMPAAAAKEPAVATYFRAFGKAGSESGQLHGANAMTVDPSGNVWVVDSESNRIEAFTGAGAFVQTFGWGVLNGKEELQDCKTTCKVGLRGANKGEFNAPQGVAYNPSNGYLYVSDGPNNRIEVFTTAGAWVKTFGETGAGNGQLNFPHGLTTDSSGNVWVADDSNSRVEEFNAEGAYQTTISKKGTGNGELSNTYDVAICGTSGNLYITDANGQRVEELTPAGTWVKTIGGPGTGAGQFTAISRITCNPTNNEIYVTDKTQNHVEVFTSTGTFVESFGATGSGAGQMSTPVGISSSTTGNIYLVDSSNNRVQEWVPSITGNTGAFNSQTIYYTPKTEASIAVCQNHPEWANLPCQVQPAHQPESPETPALPTTTFTYNIYDETETTKSTNGENTRTQTDHYNPAGRLETKEIASTTGEALPKITYKYNTETGVLTKQSTGTGAEEKTITQEYNRLGQLTSYTDADGATTTYEYEKEGDYRLQKVADPQGNQTYTYDETTGQITSTKDSGAGTFTATYDPEGNLTSETLPNGLKATTTLNPVGETVALKYVKETHCTTACEWFTDTVTPSIHGQWMTQTSTTETNKYTYNEAGWLTETQSTPTGKACTARLYSYDPDGNRKKLTKHTCGTEGGETEQHAYDTADRLIDAGTTYNPFGDITAIPAADIEGATLTSKYYADGQLSSQEQSAQTNGYALDPARRTRETISVGHNTSDITNHYDSPSSSPTWTSAISGETTREIPGLSGGLAAIQHGAATPELQVANLHGDVIGTVLDSETATALTATPATTEYGTPTAAELPKYSWLGATGLSTELPSGASDMGARSYIPQLGRFLQPDPQPGGAVNTYAYTSNDPVNERDPTGEWSLNQTSGGLSSVGEGEGEQLAGGTGIAAGAIIPPPPDAQAEQALAEDPPWDTVQAGEGPQGGMAPIAPCRGINACAARSLFSRAWHYVTHNVTKVLRSGTKVLVGVTVVAASVAIAVGTVVATAACLAATEGADELECYKIALGGGSAAAASFVAGTAVLSSALHEYF